MHESWDRFFRNEMSQRYYHELSDRVYRERSSYDIFPQENEVFKAFELTPAEKARVVILGQDPYPTPGDACGLAFSVKKGQPLPRSLRNIFREISLEYGTWTRADGDLSDWAEQGVFLLNTVLTVRSGDAGSHRGYGWEIFTDHAISYLNSIGHPIAFMLWGADAGKKSSLITDPEHLMIRTSHPSPLSANRGFFGSGCFKRADEFLKDIGTSVIHWG